MLFLQSFFVKEFIDIIEDRIRLHPITVNYKFLYNEEFDPGSG